ncbi:alpha/beta fold hydrolase [Fischerella sp. PCC 9605]|uniref:alpha/beta fold hydrolase n=1 Tax=Fischerella sp. PCC 9605 TaxID=1173024 RepID=UPI0004BC337D|nr:alpha/beta hydrolase [Fischerella sp. PCC 9605]
MSNQFDVLWLNASQSLKGFDLPLLQYLSKHLLIARWEYYQTKDEASSIDTAVTMLYDFLKSHDRPVNLAGHGMSGAIALMFARRYPQRVRSLALLAVGSQPANTWHAHYYQQRTLLPLSREQVLLNNVGMLFGNQPPHTTQKLMAALDRDLDESPTLHSLLRLVNFPKGGVVMPMFVCGSKTDPVVSPPELYDWRHLLKSEDTLWECAKGYHFFHYFYPQQVGDQLLSFWQRFTQDSEPKTNIKTSQANTPSSDGTVRMGK